MDPDGRTVPTYESLMPGHGDQVSHERLHQLLDQGEGVDLDFKAECDLNDRAGLVAITKDIAALSATGGHLIIGVGEDGTPSGRFTAAAAALFDEATLRSKLAPRYLPEAISITTAVHDLCRRTCSHRLRRSSPEWVCRHVERR
jgi:hypothetical protein